MEEYVCVNLNKLNQTVKREDYTLPYLDDIAPKWSKATVLVFSKLVLSLYFKTTATKSHENNYNPHFKGLKNAFSNTVMSLKIVQYAYCKHKNIDEMIIQSPLH